jgi:hypothetical protein
MTVSDQASQSDTAANTSPAAAAGQPRLSQHISFLAYDGYRYLWWAVALVVASLVMYVVVRPYGSSFGGGVTGYTLGTIGALLILWLTWFGYRKRRYDSPLAGGKDAQGHEQEDHGRLARRLSAHVYFGSALLIIATLHTGFHFGWNVHTLAYVLMCVVILSGVFGVIAYIRYPRQMTENRENMTTAQMISRIAAVDDELRSLALPLDDAMSAKVNVATETTLIGGSAWRQLSNSYPDCQTAAAIAYMEATASNVSEAQQDDWRKVRLKLDEKANLLTRIRRDARFKAMMEVWLYLHVPVTFALLAALSAHVLSMFFLW